MKHLLTAAVVALAWSSAASAASIRIEPVETLGSPVEYADGVAGASSRLARSEAALMVRRSTLDEDGIPELSIGVANLGQASFNLTPANVRITTQSGEELAIFTREDLLAQVEADAVKRAKRARMLAALDGVSAAMRDQPAPPDRRLQENAARADDDAVAIVQTASAYGFVAQTVRPGEKHMTDLGLAGVPKNASVIRIEVTVAGETHIFPLRVTRLR